MAIFLSQFYLAGCAPPGSFTEFANIWNGEMMMTANIPNNLRPLVEVMARLISLQINPHYTELPQWQKDVWNNHANRIIGVLIKAGWTITPPETKENDNENG